MEESSLLIGAVNEQSGAEAAEGWVWRVEPDFSGVFRVGCLAAEPRYVDIERLWVASVGVWRAYDGRGGGVASRRDAEERLDASDEFVSMRCFHLGGSVTGGMVPV